MRILFMLAFAIAMPAIAAEPDQPPPPPAQPIAAPACEDHAITVATTDKAIGVRPLGEEPDARHLLAVVRTIDGCGRPIAVHERVGFQRR